MNITRRTSRLATVTQRKTAATAGCPSLGEAIARTANSRELATRPMTLPAPILPLLVSALPLLPCLCSVSLLKHRHRQIRARSRTPALLLSSILAVEVL